MRGAVIGGSAGALDALNALLCALPPVTDTSLFVVIHITPTADSLLPAAIGAYTAMPVREAVDKLRIDAGIIVVAPPDYHMLIERDLTVSLSRDAHVHFSRPAIDSLFETAAFTFGARGIGVLLSGGNADGAMGLVAIRAAGGKVAVQTPDSSTSPQMARAALAALTPQLEGAP